MEDNPGLTGVDRGVRAAAFAFTGVAGRIVDEGDDSDKLYAKSLPALDLGGVDGVGCSIVIRGNH